MVKLFEEMGVDMYFEGDVDETRICQIPIDSIMNQEDIIWMVKESMR